MKKQDIKNIMERTELLDRLFVLDYLYPIYGKDSVDTLFSNWTYSQKNSWNEFKNSDTDILEFYPEGTYVIKKNNREKSLYQARIPETVSDFIKDMNKAGIELAT